jgi:acyl dehydratase
MAVSKFSMGSVWRSEPIIILPDEVRFYAEATGDWQPIHFSDEAALKIGSPKITGKIVHGGLVLGKALGWVQANLLPVGRVAIFRSISDWKMRSHVQCGDKLQLRVEVIKNLCRKQMEMIDLQVSISKGEEVCQTGVWQLILK